MAKAFKNLAASGVKIFNNPEEFKSRLVNGYILFVIGKNAYDVAIKAVCDNPITHVGYLFQEKLTNKWLVLEAQIGVNVRIGSLDYYLNSDKYQLVVGNHIDWSINRVTTALDTGFGFLDDKYDVGEIMKILAHHFMPWIPVNPEHGEYICSELVAAVLNSSGMPIDQVSGGNTPVSVYEDRHIEPVFAFSHTI